MFVQQTHISTVYIQRDRHTDRHTYSQTERQTAYRIYREHYNITPTRQTLEFILDDIYIYRYVRVSVALESSERTYMY